MEKLWQYLWTKFGSIPFDTILLLSMCETALDFILVSWGSNVLELVAGDLPVVISCASLALADAGIMMYDLVTSVSVVCLLLIYSELLQSVLRHLGA